MGFGALPRTDSFARLKKEGLKRFAMWQVGKSPKAIDLSVQDKSEEFELFKEYEVKRQLFATSAESDGSPVVGGYPAGTYVRVLSIGKACGSARRLKVSNKSGSVIGWVSSMSYGEPSLDKTARSILDFSSLRRNSRSNSLSSMISSSATKLRSKDSLEKQPTKSPEIGDWLEVKGKVVMRETESMSSSKIVTLKGGCQMRIVDHGQNSKNRVKVSVDGNIGWVTILDTNFQEPLFGRRPHTH